MAISKYWRPSRPQDPTNMMKNNFTDVPATRLFDNLWFIGNDMLGSFLMDTGQGLILIDCMMPGFMDYLVERITDIGFDPADVKAILITHGHFDHYGDAGKIREAYGSKIYMSQVDEEYARQPFPLIDGSSQPGIDWNADGYLVPGEDFTLGEARIEVFDTPGHTPGCVSFIFTVYDNGVPHKCMLWGGTGANADKDMVYMQLRSVDLFDEACRMRDVDVEVSNHPFTDNLVERMDVMRNLVDGMPHPLIMGGEGVHMILMYYRGMYLDALGK